MPYPRNAAERAERRAERSIERLDWAPRLKARSAGISGACWDDMHYGTPTAQHRCRNDGSSCLCECHDLAEVTT